MSGDLGILTITLPDADRLQAGEHVTFRTQTFDVDGILVEDTIDHFTPRAGLVVAQGGFTILEISDIALLGGDSERVDLLTGETLGTAKVIEP